MGEVWITGIGYATSIGNTSEQVAQALRGAQSGIVPAVWPESLGKPIKLWAPAKGFDTTSTDPEDWTAPEGFALPGEVLRSIPPSGFYAFWCVAQALKEAGLTAAELGGGHTGLYTASAGSVRTMHRHLTRMYERGAMGSSPMGVLSSVVGTLNFNLAAYYKITGHSCGFASACASSGHALGFAFDALSAGVQDRFVVVGAEDDTAETILPFASMRVLSTAGSVEEFCGPFDAKRTGFVGTGGAVAMILERAEVAVARGAKALAILKGYGQATDGYHPAKPHPEGAGIATAMTLAMERAGVAPAQIDYINAHATGTSVGDFAEMKAFRKIFGKTTPAISSTKGLTGHGLSLASIMELAIAVWATREGVVPGNFGLKQLDPLAVGLNIVATPQKKEIKVAMSNSSGFGGANVCWIVGKT